jgi:hypothetical protein
MSPRRRSLTRHWQGEVLRGHTHSDGIVLVPVLGLAFYTDRVDDSPWFGSMRLGTATLHPLALIHAQSGSAMVGATLRIRSLEYDFLPGDPRTPNALSIS